MYPMTSDALAASPRRAADVTASQLDAVKDRANQPGFLLSN